MNLKFFCLEQHKKHTVVLNWLNIRFVDFYQLICFWTPKFVKQTAKYILNKLNLLYLSFIKTNAQISKTT